MTTVKDIIRRVLAPLSLILMTLATVGSCKGTHDSTGYTDLPVEGWVYGDSVFLTLRADSVKAGRSGSVELGLRHTGEYPFSNLWLEVRMVDKNKQLHIDTIGIDLCDPYGHWYGKGIGDSFQLTAPISRTVVLDTVTRVTVRHIMRVDTLYGMSQIGILFHPEGQP